jgi:transposase
MNHESLIAENEALLSQVRDLTLKIADLSHQLEQLKKLIYGRKSERFIPAVSSNQLSLFGDVVAVEQEEAPAKETITYERTKKQSEHKGRQLLASCSHLPAEEEVIDVAHDEADKHIGDEVSEKLAYKPGRLFIRRIIRRKYKKANEDKIIIAPMVEEPIARCEADVTLLAHIIVSKIVDHQPENRQLQILKREGVDIPSSTANGWVHQTGPLIKPMAEYIRTDILSSSYIQHDESTIRVMGEKKGSTHLGYMWVMSSPNTGGVSFCYHKSRGREGPEEWLKGYKGLLQTDGYEVYDHIDKQNEDIEHFGCWAHARRYFFEAQNNDKTRSEHALGMIRKLYAIEDTCRTQTYDAKKRKEERKQSKEILEEFKQWLDEQYLKVTPKSPIGKAIGYALRRWNKLTKYTDYGQVEIDNNLIENAIRPLALGRKNYLFAGNHEAAQTLGHYYTVFGTCKRLGVNPYEYMVWFLKRVASTKITEIGTISPMAYQQTLNKSNM